MVLADTLGILLVVLGVLAATLGLWLFNTALLPVLSGTAGARMRSSPFKSFFLGLVVLLATVFSVAVLSKLGKGLNELLELVLIASFLFLSSIAVAGFAALVSERLGFDSAKPWRLVASGGMVLELTFLFPLLGWIIIFPLITITGAGATAITLLGSISGAKSSKNSDSPSTVQETAESVKL
jgi:hypothetical protein